MKEKGEALKNPNGGATNSSGFTALPRVSYHQGCILRHWQLGNWWSSTNSTSNAWSRYLY
jgi:hypothetical protein